VGQSGVDARGGRRWRLYWRAHALTLAVCLLACGSELEIDRSGPTAQWPDYAGDKGGLHYSPLTQIDRENVDELELAWVHRSGDVSDGTGETTRTSFQVTPIVAEGALYYCTGYNRVFALDPETGEERWVFDPQLRAKRLQGPYPLTCRGVSYWKDPAAAKGDSCASRIFTGTIDSQLIALDAKTGVPCTGFGTAGRVDLREGLADAPEWEYYVTSPPLTLRDLVVVGALVADNVRVDAPSGVVRAFDARSGALRWAWDPVPPGWKQRRAGSAEDGDALYQSGTPNVWSILAGDEERGLIFVPTGNPSPDMFSRVREGLDHYGSSVVALDAESGELRWFFQTVHNDVWDYDVATQPTLLQVDGVGGGAPALLQATKMGHVFLLDRTTGEPLYPIEERAVPPGAVEGERLSPTQPFPTHPPPLHPALLRPDMAFGFTPFDRVDCREKIAERRSEGIFTPPSLEGSIQYPASLGGMNWGGVAVDPLRGILYTNQSHAAQVVQLVPREEFEQLDPASVVYPEELYPMEGAPYGLRRSALLSNLGAPCNPPPWGTLSAIDLVTGERLWTATLGSTRDQAPFPLWLDYGSPNLGGAVVTAGGLVFIGATTDKFLRAFDAESGEEIWQQRLPYTANATPMTYRLRDDSRQFGGHGWSEPGDALMAFALPAE